MLNNKEKWKVKKLINIEFETIIDCFLISFENYFVEMPSDINYYKKRWETAKVDFNLSYGMFDNEKLVGFIINAIDERNGTKIAFNTGTGVLPKYRGNRIVKSIYDFAKTDLKKSGIKKCSLEVITGNLKAIKSYQSIGFKISKTLKCYKGKINIVNNDNIELNKVDYDTFIWNDLINQDMYSWDNHSKVIKGNNYDYYQLIKDNFPEAYFVINPTNGYITQFEVLKENKGSWNRLFSCIRQISENVKINNIDKQLNKKIRLMKSVGLKNTINQYEMVMIL